MSNLKFLRSVALILLFSIGVAHAQYGEVPDLPPKTYTSPSGEMVLSVNPGERSGAGKAQYALKKNGTVVWSAEQAFTFWQATVADSGSVAGYAYSYGYNSDAGEFIIATIDPRGAMHALEKIPRQSSPFLHTMGNPKAADIFIDADNNRIVARVLDPDSNAGAEAWWVYRLNDNKPIGKPKPKLLMRDTRNIREIIDARPIPKTPLTLVQWYRFVGEDECTQGKHGTRFTLLDLNYKPVWTLDLPDDYTIRGEEKAEEDLQQDMREHGAILDTSHASRFELRHVADRTRVSYNIEKDPKQATGWKVSEVATTPYVAVRKQSGSPNEISFAEVTLRKLGSITLGAESAHADVSPIHDISDFVIDDHGRFGFFDTPDCNSGDGLSLSMVDNRGRLVKNIALPGLKTKCAIKHSAAWLGGDRWIVTGSGDGEDKLSSAVWVNISSEKVIPVDGFSLPEIKSMAAWRDGGIVALTTTRSRHTLENKLFTLDATGKTRWNVEEGSEDKAKLFSPEAVTITSTGDVVVLDNIENRLQIYSRDGAYRSSVDLAQAWHQQPNYPSGIKADIDGGVIVHDFQGKPSVVRMKLDGTVISKFTPKYADGREFDIRGDVQSDPDGRLWTSDGHALLRLDQYGVVDRVLGQKPDTDALGQVAAMTINEQGKIYAADTRTGAVHVFDGEGHRVLVCHPKTDDYAGDLWNPSLTVNDRGDVFIARGSVANDRGEQFLHYSPRCDRLGIETAKLGEVAQDRLSQHGTTNQWVLGFTSAYLIDAQGAISRKLDRTAAAEWLEHPGPAGVAADGSVAIFSGIDAPFLGNGKSNAPVATVFSASGDALTTFAVPRGTITWAGNIAFDGKQLIFLVALDDAKTKLSVVAMDIHGKPLFRFTPPSLTQNAHVALVHRQNELELWIFDGKTTVNRYAFP